VLLSLNLQQLKWQHAQFQYPLFEVQNYALEPSFSSKVSFLKPANDPIQLIFQPTFSPNLSLLELGYQSLFVVGQLQAFTCSTPPETWLEGFGNRIKPDSFHSSHHKEWLKA
jgi:hypothetical protein